MKHSNISDSEIRRKINSTMSSTSTPLKTGRTPTRLRRSRKGLSGSGKKSFSRQPGTVSERLSQETNDKLNLNGAKPRERTIGSPVIRPRARPVFLDGDDGSPVRIPNSQAPIEDREVFWDLDTPETKRTREALYKQMEAKADSPVVVSRNNSLTPTLKLVPRKRPDFASGPKRGVETAGAKALAELELFLKQAEESESAIRVDAEESPRTDNSPQDSGDNGSSDIFGEDFDSADDEILLLATQQPIEDGKTAPTPSPSFSGDKEKLSSASDQPKPLTPRKEVVSAASNAADDIDDFFGEDDDFDEVMSQMEMPVLAPVPKVTQTQTSASSLTLAPPPSSTSSSKSPAQGSVKPRTPNVRYSNFAIKGFESEFDDSFDNVLSQIEVPTIAPPNKNLTIQVHGAGQTGPLTSTQKPSPLAAKTPVVQQKPKLTFQFPPKKSFQIAKENVSESSNSLLRSGGGGPVRKFKSFESAPKEKRLIAKFKSDPLITNKPSCSKEEIEKKKKEALARKQMLQSQKQQRS